MAPRQKIRHLAVSDLKIGGTDVVTSLLLATGQAVDLNGETGGLIIDADANTKIYGSADDEITVNVGGAADFKIAANLLTALSGSTIATNTIAETTGASGVTIDSVLLKDGGVTLTGATALSTDIISEKTAASGVTVDGLLIKDAGLVAGTSGYVDLNGETGGLVFDTDGNTKMYASADDVITINIAAAADFTLGANLLTALSGSVIATNTISETTATSGVTIDGLLIKDGIAGTIQAITGDGAITIQPAHVFLSKGSAGAITLAAPTNVTHDGFVVHVTAISAQAHVITGGVDGFNAKGSSGTATFGGAKGDSVSFVAYGGHWYTIAKVNVTIA